MSMATNRSIKTRAASLTAAALLAATGLLAAGGTAHAERTASDTLANGGTLTPGAGLDSGDAHLVMQQDGDLALYTSGADGTGRQLRWHSGTTGEGNRAELRADGNLVVTAQDGTELWQSRTGSTDCPHMPWTKLTVRSHGDMSILAGQDSEAPYYVPLWSASFGLQPPCGYSAR
ncbi:hypothetical protein Q3V23_33005 [Streptomyces sp. VNUA116]|uniref:hypothetical protein n=1 Tax=Streptomyces sp. VNUA116 TaxID=3062449 RepID=UPI002674DD6D|nr:hypothetical protein [Streptomyces sp. VNUA116]WKU48506.1 hypothetical protein Q3V23_33005 [Streptomyces sp. VNUA116]